MTTRKCFAQIPFTRYQIVNRSFVDGSSIVRRALFRLALVSLSLFFDIADTNRAPFFLSFSRRVSLTQIIRRQFVFQHSYKNIELSLLGERKKKRRRRERSGINNSHRIRDHYRLTTQYFSSPLMSGQSAIIIKSFSLGDSARNQSGISICPGNVRMYGGICVRYTLCLFNDAFREGRTRMSNQICATTKNYIKYERYIFIREEDFRNQGREWSRPTERSKFKSVRTPIRAINSSGTYSGIIIIIPAIRTYLYT